MADERPRSCESPRPLARQRARRLADRHGRRADEGGLALTDAGDGPIRRLVHVSPASFYAELVALGGETPEQVLNAARLLGTAPERIVDKTVPGGHIGLFMGARTLAEHWPELARWIVAQSA